MDLISFSEICMERLKKEKKKDVAGSVVSVFYLTFRKRLLWKMLSFVNRLLKQEMGLITNMQEVKYFGP